MDTIIEQVKQEFPEAQGTEMEPFIISQVKEFNFTEETIKKLVEDCLALSVSGPEDEKNYQLCHRANIDIKKKITAVKDRGLELREKNNLENKIIISVERKIAQMLTVAREHLEKQKEVVEAAEKAKKEEKAKALQDRYESRVSELSKIGCTFDGKKHSYFELIDGGEVSITDPQLKDIEEPFYRNFYDKVKLYFDRHEKKMEELKLDQEKMKLREAELKKQREEIDRQTKAIAEQKFKARELQLINLDFSWNGFKYKYLNVISVEKDVLLEYSDDAWNEHFEEAKKIVQEFKNKTAEADALEKETNDRYNTRVEKLQAAGFHFEDKVFKYDLIEIQLADVSDLSDETFSKLLAKKIEERKQLDGIREKRAKDQLEKQIQERERRIRVLNEIGLKFDGENYTFRDINFHSSELSIMSVEEFEITVAGAQGRMKQILQEEEDQNRFKAERMPDIEKIELFFNHFQMLARPEISDERLREAFRGALSVIDGAIQPLKKLLETLKK